MEVNGQVVMVIHHDVAVTAVKVSVKITAMLDHFVLLTCHFLSGGNDRTAGYHQAAADRHKKLLRVSL